MNGPEMQRQDGQNFFLKLTIFKKKKKISWKKNIVLKKNIIGEFSYCY